MWRHSLLYVHEFANVNEMGFPGFRLSAMYQMAHLSKKPSRPARIQSGRLAHAGFKAIIFQKLYQTTAGKRVDMLPRVKYTTAVRTHRLDSIQVFIVRSRKNQMPTGNEETFDLL